MDDLKIRLYGFAAAMFLAVVFAIWVSNLPSAPVAAAQTDLRSSFVSQCMKDSGMGLKMRPVCSCVYDNVINGVEINDELSAKCLKASGLIE